MYFIQIPKAVRYSERSNSKCIGITIETRPDYCLKRHQSDMLRYGCTRLEIGVQSVFRLKSWLHLMAFDTKFQRIVGL